MPWLTDNVFVQQAVDPLSSVLTALPKPPAQGSSNFPRQFVHILNPYRCPPGSFGEQVQELTFEGLRRASEYASDSVSVKIVCIVFPEDRDCEPIVGLRPQ